MKSRIAAGIAAASLGVLGLTACSSGASSTNPYSAPVAATTTSAPASAPAAAGASLMMANSSLGSIVVDGSGKVVYQFDADTKGSGKSSCTGSCLTSWPPVHAGAGTPKLTGVTGAVATITGTDGQPQLTLNGWPLYYFAGDAAAGDTKGQGVGGKWWVLTPAGEPVHS